MIKAYRNMISHEDTPDEKYWVAVNGDGRIHPYAMYKRVNRKDIEVVNSVTGGERAAKRWVIIRGGSYKVWVRVAEQDDYGYELRPDEQVSAAELDAITLKQAAIRNDECVTVEEAQALVDSGDPEQAPHALIALFYAAQADPDIPDDDVDRLRELMHEHTGHVDTSHKPTVMGILDEAIGDTELADGS